MTASIQTLLDENGNQLLPRTLTKAVYNPDGTTWQDAMNAKADKPRTVELTLTASGWLGSANPYIQTVVVQGMTADANGIGEISDIATDEQWNAAMDADLRKSIQSVNSMTFKAYGDKPAVDIPYSLLIVW